LPAQISGIPVRVHASPAQRKLVREASAHARTNATAALRRALRLPATEGAPDGQLVAAELESEPDEARTPLFELAVGT